MKQFDYPEWCAFSMTKFASQLVVLTTVLCCAGFISAEEVAGPSEKSRQSFRAENYRLSERILIGKLPIVVTPKREYIIKANSSGLLKLYVDPHPQSFKTGDKLGGIDTERIELDERLLELGENLLSKRDIPEAKLQRRNKIQQLERRQATLDAEIKLINQVIQNPEKYKDIFGRAEDQETIKTSLAKQTKEREALGGLLKFVKSPEFEELEHEELTTKFELKKLQFEMRQRDAYLTVPFDGDVKFVFPYVQDELNFVGSGTDIAVVQDKSEIFAQVPILDSDWRSLIESRMELSLRTSSGVTTASFQSSSKQIVSGKERLVYSFMFRPEDHKHLQNYMGGSVEGSVYYRLDKAAHLVPKFLLASMDTAAFKSGGWEGVVASILPEYQVVYVGLNNIALGKKPEPTNDKGVLLDKNDSRGRN